MTAWTAIAMAGLASYLLRIVPLAVLSRTGTPGWLERAGGLVAPVAFAAMAASAVAGAASGGVTELLPRIAAVAVAGPVAWRTRSTGATVVAGMVTLWVSTAIAGS